RRGRVRGIGVAFLAHALAPPGDGAGARAGPPGERWRPADLGAARDPSAARAAGLYPLPADLREHGLALRLRPGAVGDDVSRGRALLDRKPVLPARRDGA